MTYHVQARDYTKNVILTGNDSSKRQNDVAMRTRLAFGEEANFTSLEIHSCGIPIRHDRGQLNIEELYCHNFTADLMNCGGNLLIERMYVEYDDESFIYSKDYHVDALGQFFSKSFTTVKNVTIKYIYARIKGEMVQGMALTESNRYTDFDIGWNGVDIEMDYRYGFIANQLDNSRINMHDQGIRIQQKVPTDAETTNVLVSTSRTKSLVLNDMALKKGQVRLV